MMKLIRLEWKKNCIGKYVRGALILAAALCLFIFAFCYLGLANDPDTGIPDTAPGNEGISSTIEMLSGMSFLIFTGVMLASFIVSAYRNKTMDLMFSYPIRRQKILISQMLAVWVFNFTALTVTKLLCYGCVLAGSRTMAPAFLLDYQMGSPSFYAELAIKSAVTVSTGFIALFAGLYFRSSKACVVASFLLIFLTQANVGSLTLSDKPVFPVMLMLLSFLFAILSVCRAETRDVM